MIKRAPIQDTRICPETGEELKRGFREIILTYEGLSTTVNMPGWYSEKLPDGIHSRQDLKVSDRALNKLKAQKENLISPEKIKETRKLLQLSQAEAGDILGGGPRAFQKYETGEILPSKAASNLLSILGKEPHLLNLVRDKTSTKNL